MTDTMLMAIMAGLLLMFLMIGGVGIVYVRSSGSRYRKRLAAISGQEARKAAAKGGSGRDAANARRRQQIQGKLKKMEDERKASSKKVTLWDLLIQADMKISVRKFYLIGLAIGAAATVLYVIMGYPLYGAIAVFIFVSFGLPRWWVKRKGKKRQKLFTKNFANAVDVIVRGIKSGLPVSECLNIIARESPYPINNEFTALIEGVKIGQPMNDVLDRGLQRIPTTEYRFFAIVLAIQQQTGGNLAETLAGLSEVLRERKKMQDQIKTMTSEARTTAMIIGSLPFCMSALMTLTSYEYIALLWQETLGHYLIAAGVTLITIGTLIMNKMISFEI
jgi:tight adherence protein B